jgi:hypothetical protein
MIAAHGDAIMFREKGTTAKAFNALAEAVALLAYCPGGITIFDQHWEVAEPMKDVVWAKKLKKVLYAKKLKNPL